MQNKNIIEAIFAGVQPRSCRPVHVNFQINTCFVICTVPDLMLYTAAMCHGRDWQQTAVMEAV